MKKNIIVESYNKMNEMFSPYEQENVAPPAEQSPVSSEPRDTGDVVDTVTMDVPLLTRMIEMGREEIEGDEQLHRIIQNLVQASKSQDTLTMDDYDSIVQDEQTQFKQEPEAEAPEQYSNY